MRDLITVVGMNHKTAPVEVREKLSFQETQLPESFQQLSRIKGVKESAILSTCNRVEIYTVFKPGTSNAQDICDFLSAFHQVPPETFRDCIYELSDAHAIRHIFRVASSLDSMVLGEPQILGQFKNAYGLATENKATGMILNRLFHKAFSVAKRVRTETRIANSAVSISFAAVELAKKIFDHLSDCQVLLIGAGEMCELAAKHFINAGIYEIYITNRTFNRAMALAEDFGGEAVPFKDYIFLLEKVDIILTSTGATEPIITADIVSRAMKKRKNRPMFFIDIAVPRDVEEKVHNLSNVFLYDIDDLKEVVTASQQEREKEAKKAEKIISEEALQFTHWMDNLEVVPTILKLREHADTIRKEELKKTISKLKNLSEKDKEAIDRLTQAIVNKLLHGPSVMLKQTEKNGAGRSAVEIVQKMFKLNNPDKANILSGKERKS